MKKVYWKVHRNNIKDMSSIGLPQSYIRVWQIESVEPDDGYMLISNDYNKPEPFGWGFMKNNKDGHAWYNEWNFKYMGVFDLKKDRRNKIRKINGSNL